MTESQSEQPVQAEVLNMARDMTPAEHLILLGSSTEFMDHTVNTESLPDLMEDSMFLGFFLKPLGVRSRTTEEEVNALNSRRSQGLTISASGFIPKGRMEEFLGKKYKISLPEYDFKSRLTGTKWQVQVIDSHGNEVSLDNTADFERDNPYFSVGVDKTGNRLVIDFDPNGSI